MSKDTAEGGHGFVARRRRAFDYPAPEEMRAGDAP